MEFSEWNVLNGILVLLLMILSMNVQQDDVTPREDLGALSCTNATKFRYNDLEDCEIYELNSTIRCVIYAVAKKNDSGIASITGVCNLRY